MDGGKDEGDLDRRRSQYQSHVRFCAKLRTKIKSLKAVSLKLALFRSGWRMFVSRGITSTRGGRGDAEDAEYTKTRGGLICLVSLVTPGHGC